MPASNVQERLGTAEKISGRFGDTLYGVRGLLAAATREQLEAIRRKIRDQEASHIMEGIDLLQCDPQSFDFDGLHVLDPYSTEAMVKVLQRAVDATASNEYPSGLRLRMLHNLAMGEWADTLMQTGEVGEGFGYFSPYAHEETDQIARDQYGMRPELHRGYYLHFRKAAENKIEITTMTIDNADLDDYLSFLRARGVLPAGAIASHDVTGILVPQIIQMGREQRADYLQAISSHYHQNSGMVSAQKFINNHAPAIEKIASIHEALAESISDNHLNTIAKAALSEAIILMSKLGYRLETGQLMLLGREKQLSLDSKHDDALRLLINIQRYGVWQYLRQILDGDALPHELQQADIRMYARRAAWKVEVIPGCPGGFGLEVMYGSIWGAEGWHGGETHIGPCDGPCGREKAVVGVGNWCYSCITGASGC